MTPRAWLLASAAVLAVLVLVEWRAAPVPPPGMPAGPVRQAPPPPPLSLPEVPPLAMLPATVERPPFTPGRRPEREDAQPEVIALPVPTGAPRIDLSAIVIAGGAPVAYLRAGAGTGNLRRAAVGDTLEGWTVSAILEDRIVIENGDRRAEIALRTFRPPPEPPERRRERGVAGAADAGDGEPVLRPRRPLRGPRQRSLQRRVEEAIQKN